MKYKYTFILIILVSSILLIFISSGNLFDKVEHKSIYNEDDKNLPKDKRTEFLKLRDPATNTIPENIFIKNHQFINDLIKTNNKLTKQNLDLLPGKWIPRGPYNHGGNTPALAIDKLNENTIIAGSSTGGIWKTVNDGKSWYKTKTDPFDLKRVANIVQDVRSGKENIWYAAAGDDYSAFGKSGEQGIFKSTDNGNTWKQLESTSYINPDFEIVYDLVVDHTNMEKTIIYCAVSGAIKKSDDGGVTWETVLGTPVFYNLNYRYTDVLITAEGVLYAVGEFYQSKGFFRSTDGIKWTKISTSDFPVIISHVILGNGASNPNLIYLLGVSNAIPNSNGHILWKYTYLSGDGTGKGGSLENLSSNIKAKRRGGDYFPIGSYRGYCLTLDVKPDNDQFVLIGGSNLFRSKKGFSTLDNKILGWETKYLHPDIQSGVFSWNNSEIFYAGTDGGIYKTKEISTDDPEHYRPVYFEKINNNYIVTQYYSVSISPDMDDEYIVGGTQDNGILASLHESDTVGVQLSTGDGIYAQIAPQKDDIVYGAIQNGVLFRFNRKGSEFSFIRPEGTNDYFRFFSYFKLDPVNPKYLYYASPDKNNNCMIWRSNDAPNATSNYSWQALTETSVGDANITAIEVASTNNSSILYYGTSEGKIFKAENIRSTPKVVEITPEYLIENTGAFLSFLSVDPYNPKVLLAVYSNYNYKSLWLSNDGGSSWVDIEGNLGGENSPAVRCGKIVYVDGKMHIFAGTEMGLFFTNNIEGSNTRWFYETSDLISNQSITWIDYRESDQTLAVATFGRGLFTKKLKEITGINSEDVTVVQTAELFQNFPNPFNLTTKIKYSIPKQSNVTLKVFDVVGSEVVTLVNSEQPKGSYEVEFNADNFSSAVYLYQIIAGKYVETKKMILIK